MLARILPRFSPMPARQILNSVQMKSSIWTAIARVKPAVDTYYHDGSKANPACTVPSRRVEMKGQANTKMPRGHPIACYRGYTNSTQKSFTSPHIPLTLLNGHDTRELYRKPLLLNYLRSQKEQFRLLFLMVPVDKFFRPDFDSSPFPSESACLFSQQHSSSLFVLHR